MQDIKNLIATEYPESNDFERAKILEFLEKTVRENLPYYIVTEREIKNNYIAWLTHCPALLNKPSYLSEGATLLQIIEEYLRRYISDIIESKKYNKLEDIYFDIIEDYQESES